MGLMSESALVLLKVENWVSKMASMKVRLCLVRQMVTVSPPQMV